MKKRNLGLGYKESKDMKIMSLFPSSVTNTAFQDMDCLKM
jgi:hypothetical protein